MDDKYLPPVIVSKYLPHVIVALVVLSFPVHRLFKHAAAPAPVAFLAENANRFERAQSSVALIETESGFGSGAVIHRGPHTFVWTANHVVRDVNEVSAIRYLHSAGHKTGKLTFKGQVIARFPSADAALVYVDCPLDAFSAVKFATESPRPGNEIFLVGNLHGENFDGSVTRGIVSQVGVEPTAETWPWNFPLDQGDFSGAGGGSGGPVFNWSGEVIGLFVRVPSQSASEISCFTPVRAINNAALLAGFGLFVYDNGSYPSVALIKELAEKAKLPPVPKATVTIVTEVPKSPKKKK